MLNVYRKNNGRLTYFRKIIPGYGCVDMASVVLALILQIILLFAVKNILLNHFSSLMVLVIIIITLKNFPGTLA